MFLGKVVFEEEQGTAAGLSQDDVQPAIVGKITARARPAVGVPARPRKETDVQKAPAANFQKGSFAFVGAKVVPLRGDLKGFVHQKLVQGGVELSRLRNM